VLVGVIDIGSNTARLLVAEVDGRGVTARSRERVYLRLGDDVHARGRIGRKKLAETARIARRFSRAARKTGAERVQTVVTAPARQAANGHDLVSLLAAETGAGVVPLSGEDEGRLAWEGAVSSMDGPEGRIAVVDLGGGSCELAVGDADAGPGTVFSADAGALRVTRDYLDGEVDARLVGGAREGIAALLAAFDPPKPESALVVGGTARAIGHVLGPRFGAEQLDALAEILEVVPPEILVRSHGVGPERTRTLLGGTLVLSELARRLATTLEVGAGGLREGAALTLARTQRAAA